MTTAAAPPLDGMRPGALMRPVAVLLLGCALLVALMAGELVAGGRSPLVFGLIGLVIPVVLWQRPDVAPIMLVAAALVIEQYPEIARPGLEGATARIPFFHGLGGFRVSDVVLALMVGIWAARRGTGVVRGAPRSPLAGALVGFLAMVAFALLLGLGTGGSLAAALTEVRPYLYLAIAYLVTATTLTSRRAVHAVLWTLVLATAVKAAQGLYIFLSVRDLAPRPDAVLAHEESLFFALFALLTAALWLYDLPGRLRRTATALVPIVIAVDLANGRRVAWLILAVCIAVLIVTGLVALPNRRAFLRRATAVLLVVSAIYFPAYWEKTGGFAQPARAFRSAVAPDPRDALSNLYRVQEEANLRLNIRAAGPLGDGFGHPIDYALPIEDISDVDPYIAYVPHNMVLHLFLRLGVLGAIAFWALIGVALVTASRLARSPDRELGVVGMLVACALPAYMLLGYNDQGFFYYRVAILMGVLLGLLEAARRLQPRPALTVVPDQRRATATPRLRPVAAPRARPRVPAAAPRHAAAPEVVGWRRRLRLLLALNAALGLTVATIGVSLILSGTSAAAPPIEQVGGHPRPDLAPAATAGVGARTPAHSARLPERRVRLMLAGREHGSWERVGAAGNLDVVVGGPDVLSGTRDLTFVPPRATA